MKKIVRLLLPLSYSIFVHIVCEITKITVGSYFKEMKMLFGLRLAVYFLLNQLWLHVSCNLFVVVVTYLNRAPFPEKNCHKLRNIVLYYTPHYTIAHLIKPYRDPVHLINWISVRFYETGCIFLKKTDFYPC